MMTTNTPYKMLIALGLCAGLMACSDDKSAEDVMDDTKAKVESAVNSGMDSAGKMADDVAAYAEDMAEDVGVAAEEMAEDTMAAAEDMADAASEEAARMTEEAKAAAAEEAREWSDKQQEDGMQKLKEKTAEMVQEN